MKIASLILFICICCNGYAQVSGRLIAADSTPVAFANIALLQPDSSLVKAVLSNDEGKYFIDKVPVGNYLLRVSMVGYRSWFSAVFELPVSTQSKDFGTIMMQAEKKQLEEVIVRAGKPVYQQRPEGTVVNVESSILSKGSTALQVLERSPGVVINHRDNSIALNGKNGVMVMLNGKLMRMPMEQLVALLNSIVQMTFQQ